MMSPVPNEEPRPVGFTTERLAAIDLATEIGKLDGHVLRASRTQVRPGGGFAAHAHNGRPEIIVMLKGTLTETRDGKPVDYTAGGVLVMAQGVTHVLQNRGAEVVEYISITVRVP
jgi:quercetin dioxygenase-like cupin family protein